MTKTELLSKLDEKDLKQIAKAENLTVPKTYGKRDLVKYLDGLLTLEKIKEYTAEVYEKETKRTIIHETIKEKGIKINSKETTKLTFDKMATIRELTHGEKIDSSVLNELANKLKEPTPNGRGSDFYDKMTDNLLEKINRIFIKKESDGKGVFLEFRTANFIMRNSKLKITRIATRHKFPEIGEIDVVGFDAEDKPIVIAECKDRHAKKEDVAKWIQNSRQIFLANDCSLEKSYFVTSDKLTDENFEYIEKSKEIDAKSGQLKTISGKLERFGQYLKDNKSFGESGKVFLSVYEVRQNQFTQIFPRK